MEGMDPLPGLLGFTTALREAGLPCDQRRVQAYLAACEQLGAGDRGRLYWAGRLTLCADPDDLPRYDRAFAAWFGDTPPPVAPRRRATPRRTRIAPLADGGGTATREAEPVTVAASDAEVLRHRDLAALTAAERDHLRELLATLRPAPPLRRSTRHRPARRGPLDPARTLRALLATGGEPAPPAHRARARRPRRVVLLIDVSGSMNPYADALLRFAHVVTRAAPRTVEVFTLGTRLTRVTRQLRQRDPELAVLAAGRAVPDYAGGTRLGETLKAFLDRWGQRGTARRAVLAIFSDGWERGDAALLGEQVARARRLAHRVFWVNPHAGREGYAPVQSGIVAALPHVDRMLAGHSLATLRRFLLEMADA
ncbi:VWA domain-containing protein [Amycolatopsis suaedae]|uniref:VWA domain-containing protein n=2 Tax=Amycolatopsis suaedae TaxID=2510978 RepID=A0A4Q7J3Z6_9PSEU|nr:VWA domain-containing protein [Amycolatopsis suaedae]RZQ60704.1 VWA domain-containing protein [Amycolatopsis suaedae]